MPYFRKRKKKSKRSLKKTMILYGGLAIVCFLISGILFFMTRMIANVEQVIMNNAIVMEAERALGRKLTDEDRNRIGNDKGMIEKVGKANRER
jgi:cell division septal protein FtsQ